MRCAWRYGFAAVAAVCLMAAPVMADVTVIGDRPAYDEVVAAFTKLFSLPGFRAKYTNPRRQGPQLKQALFEYAAPNSWHMGGQGAPVEVIKVGDHVATRISLPGQPSGWRCKQATAHRPLFDPTRASGTYNVTRGPDTVIEGTPVHTILWQEGNKRSTAYLGSQNGLPKRVIAEDNTIIDYYDYGAQVVITLPPCTQ